MNFVNRMTVGTSGLVVLTLGLGGVYLGCASWSFLGSDTAMVSLTEEERTRNEQLQKLQSAVLRRVKAKEQVVRDLIDQRKTLTEAINEFQSLNEQWPIFTPDVPKVPALGTDEERILREIHALVREILRDQPKEADVVVRRLKENSPNGRLVPHSDHE
jgi:hypothetical protein